MSATATALGAAPSLATRVVRQTRSEAYRAVSLRLTWGLAVLGAGYATFNAGVIALLTGSEQLEAPGGLPAEAAVASVYGAGLSAYPFVLVAGIMLVTGEFRHGTASTTFLVNPRRGSVVTAKFLSAFAVGVAYAAVATLAALTVGVMILSIRGYADLLPASTAAQVALGGFLACSLYGVMGVGIGAVVRNQVAAIIGALIGFMVVSDLLAAFLPDVGRWFPSGAANAVAQIGSGNGDMLPPWAGALVFLAWAVAFAVAGTVLTLRRDV